ncbi:MAG: DNA methyltransferase, partial [Bacilli bacterium]
NNNFEIYLGKNFGTYRTVWVDPKYDANEYGKKMLNNIVIGNNFEYPKSLYNVYDCLYAIIATNKNAIALDFFAGSGTTAQAVLELNKEDGGNRQFILCTNNENNICEDITYQRIKTVITGKRKDGSIYSEGIPANLKYFKTSYIPRINNEKENLHSNLLVNIKNLIELENGINIDDKKIRVYLNENELDQFSNNENDLKKCEIIYISSDVLLTGEQEQKFRDNNIEVFIIPEYYFEDEIMEVL